MKETSSNGLIFSFNKRHFVFLISILFYLTSTAAFATACDQAKRIHGRLAASPPSEAVLSFMAAKISSGDAIGAVMEVMDNPGFYNIFLKNHVTPWTNIAQTVYAPLTDYTTTIIGIVRDDVAFNEILTGDVVDVGTTANLTPYSHTDNLHYQELEDSVVGTFI